MATGSSPAGLRGLGGDSLEPGPGRRIGKRQLPFLQAAPILSLRSNGRARNASDRRPWRRRRRRSSMPGSRWPPNPAPSRRRPTTKPASAMASKRTSPRTRPSSTKAGSAAFPWLSQREDDMMDLLDILLGLEAETDLSALQMGARALVVYLVTLAIIRVGKKRFMGRATAFDISSGSSSARSPAGRSPAMRPWCRPWRRPRW